MFQACAVGFEPNKNLASGLKDLESSYNKCGWRTTIYTQTGVDIAAGKAKVILDIWILLLHMYIPKVIRDK